MLITTLVLGLSLGPATLAGQPCTHAKDCFDAGFVPDGGWLCQTICPPETSCSSTPVCCVGAGQACEATSDCCGDVPLQCAKVNPTDVWGTCCNQYSPLLGDPYFFPECGQNADCCGSNPFSGNHYGNSTNYCSAENVCLQCYSVGIFFSQSPQQLCEYDAGYPNLAGTQGLCCPGLTCNTIRVFDDAGGTIDGGDIECCSYLGQPCVNYAVSPDGFNGNSCCPYAAVATSPHHNYDPYKVTCGPHGVCCEKEYGKCSQDSDCCGWHCDAGICDCE